MVENLGIQFPHERFRSGCGLDQNAIAGLDIRRVPNEYFGKFFEAFICQEVLLEIQILEIISTSRKRSKARPRATRGLH